MREPVVEAAQHKSVMERAGEVTILQPRLQIQLLLQTPDQLAQITILSLNRL